MITKQNLVEKSQPNSRAANKHMRLLYFPETATLSNQPLAKTLNPTHTTATTTSLTPAAQLKVTSKLNAAIASNLDRQRERLGSLQTVLSWARLESITELSCLCRVKND